MGVISDIVCDIIRAGPHCLGRLPPSAAVPSGQERVFAHQALPMGPSRHPFCFWGLGLPTATLATHVGEGLWLWAVSP